MIEILSSQEENIYVNSKHKNCWISIARTILFKIRIFKMERTLINVYECRIKKQRNEIYSNYH